MVSLAPAIDLRQEPEAPLRERQRQRSPAWQARYARELRRYAATQLRGEPRQGGPLEQLAQRKLDREHGAHAREQPYGQQRVAAQIEEVIVTSHLLDLQELRPKRREFLLVF